MSQALKLTILNGVCPYYTMYPLDFPLDVLSNGANSREWVLDPFCGRGTTNFAARLLGLPTVGLDSSPIAVSIAKAKLLSLSADTVAETAGAILAEANSPADIPGSEFWQWAFHKDTLRDLCCLREALMANCEDPARIMLRAILLGALHGPLNKGEASYFSNQCPRTFAPKPTYATRFWKTQQMCPPWVNVLGVIQRKAIHYLGEQPEVVDGSILHMDSRQPEAFDRLPRFSWVITSPPYYGMRTYIPDQWLRSWFLGGPSEVVYRHPEGEIAHGSPEEFASQLAQVWRNTANVCMARAKLVCRFGGIQDRKQDPVGLIRTSLKQTGWRITAIRDAGNALDGKRQAAQFGERTLHKPRPEYDIYAILND
jgi:hypothetical protein